MPNLLPNSYVLEIEIDSRNYSYFPEQTTSITVLCYIINYNKKTYNTKNLSIIEASGIVRSRSLNSSLNVTLVGFYPHDLDQELSLSEFENEDVVLATGNFRIIEDINKNGKKYPVLK
ncbi:9608_t:CDS:2, partial [Scutellospora calospora]